MQGKFAHEASNSKSWASQPAKFATKMVNHTQTLNIFSDLITNVRFSVYWLRFRLGEF